MMMKKRQLAANLVKLFSFASLLLLTACSKMVVLHPRGVVAADERDLLITAVLLMLTIVIPVIILVLVISRYYRASNKKATYTPEWAHSNKLEAVWWTIPIILIIALSIIIWRSTHRLDPYRQLDVGGKPITVQVIALRWKWLFIYPKQNIATVNFVEFPVNKQVQFLITSDAPMNSFQIPQLGGQIYSMNGMQTKLHLIANQIGNYKGRSVSFSGAGFSDMKFTAKAVSAQDFNQWVQQVKGSAKQLNSQAYQQLAKPSENNPVDYYASVESGLFKKIIHQFMFMDKMAPKKQADQAPAKPAVHL